MIDVLEYENYAQIFLIIEEFLDLLDHFYCLIFVHHLFHAQSFVKFTQYFLLRVVQNRVDSDEFKLIDLL